MSLTKDVNFGPVWTLHVDVSKIRHFLLPAGGADYNGYWPLDVFRPTLIKPVKFGEDHTFYAELQQLLFPWRDIEFVTPPWTRPLTKTQDLHNLTSQRPLD